MGVLGIRNQDTTRTTEVFKGWQDCYEKNCGLVSIYVSMPPMNYWTFLKERVATSFLKTRLFFIEHLLVDTGTIIIGGMFGYLVQGDAANKLANSALGGLAALAILTACTFLFNYATIPASVVADLQSRITQAKPKVKILFTPACPPFEQIFQHMRLFCVGISNPGIETIEDVSVRVEQIEPNPWNVPFLELTESVEPFAQYHNPTKKDWPRHTAFNLNPNQTRYVGVVFMYEGLQSPHIEICFLTDYLLPAGRYIFGLRATGRNLEPDYAEFEIMMTEQRALSFTRI